MKAADRDALYVKCARVYWQASFTADSDRAVRTLATLPNWREAIDTAYEAGLADGARLAVGTVGECPAGYDESDDWTAGLFPDICKLPACGCDGRAHP